MPPSSRPTLRSIGTPTATLLVPSALRAPMSGYRHVEMTFNAEDAANLSSLVREAISSRPPTYESAAVAFALIERSVSHLGGVAGAGVVQSGQLARFMRSLDWQSGSPGRRMTVSEALAFVDRLARASEAVAPERPSIRRGRPVSPR